MELTIINKIRTNNFNDERVIQKITDMWKGALTELSNHEGNTYGLYYEYESNYKGDYTLGVAIEGKDESTIVIPHNTKHEVFKVNTDEEQGIFNTWNEIWKKKKKVNYNEHILMILKSITQMAILISILLLKKNSHTC